MSKLKCLQEIIDNDGNTSLFLGYETNHPKGTLSVYDSRNVGKAYSAYHNIKAADLESSGKEICITEFQRSKKVSPQRERHPDFFHCQ
jgi:uncharacterized protein YigE (DUF2233 family)